MAELTRVKTRELVIGDPWEVLVRVRNMDMSSEPWASQLRPYLESDEVLATPLVTTEMDGSDTLVHITLSPQQTSTLNVNRCVWGLKAAQALFWGDLVLVEGLVR